ncbi:MAG: Holliday junction branch migration protein RuvA [bacterium TMED217]|nr:MAG: Holliday junction branch migration protein RuvA [bacterium TMED217]|tara:strand:- start:1988 stop:2584 length:597 start_codon:yes stop_codon:yes gene_type:complete
MIYQISGNLISKHKDFVVLKVGEFGIKVSCTVNTINSIKTDDKIQLYTYLHVREDALDLYGFYSIFEREIFLFLIGISGIGPKLGATILSGILPNEFKEKVISGDVGALTEISGVGAKTAKRIIIELKDKFIKIGDDNIGFKDDISPKLYDDALNALLSLGYSSQQSKKALTQIFKAESNQGNNIESIIKAALKNING